MTDSHDDAVPAVKPKNKGGRPKKGPDLGQVVKDLQDQIAIMQRAALANQANNADRFEQFQQQATLAPVPAASAETPPGTYVQVGVDASGAALMRKVRWTKPMIESTYPPVTFVPMRDFTCGPHGIIYRIEPGKMVTVPQIVKDLYDEDTKVSSVRMVDGQDANKAWTPAERAELDARAADTPGVGHKSRLARVGGGLNVHAADPVVPAGGETPVR